MSRQTSTVTRQGMKCYCGFVAETESKLREHIITVHGARDGDWKGWVAG